MLKLEIDIEGCTTDDLTLAIDEVKRYVKEGCLSGANSSDTGEYYFNVMGEEEEIEEDE